MATLKEWTTTPIDVDDDGRVPVGGFDDPDPATFEKMLVEAVDKIVPSVDASADEWLAVLDRLTPAQRCAVLWVVSDPDHRARGNRTAKVNVTLRPFEHAIIKHLAKLTGTSEMNVVRLAVKAEYARANGQDIPPARRLEGK